jgi:hypothetical protein
VFIGDDVSDLERLGHPDPADAVEDVDDALRAPVRACPGEHLVQLGVVEVQRNICDVAGGKTAHVIDARGIREERLHQLKRGLHLNLQRLCLSGLGVHDSGTLLRFVKRLGVVVGDLATVAFTDRYGIHELSTFAPQWQAQLS